MVVKELIKALNKMPQNADVLHLWDGEPRTTIDVVYESRIGEIITAPFNMVAYSTDARPKDAPTSVEDRYWHTAYDPNDYTEEDEVESK